MTDLTPVFNAIITLATALVTVFFIPWIRSRTTAEQREELLAWVKIAVQAAEQIYSQAGMGETKKQYVTEFLALHGFELDELAIDAAIEAAVLELKEADRKE